MIGTPRRFSCETRPKSSSEAPLFESTIATSSRLTMPRSPCRESTGWRNVAGVPVEVNVAAILRAISPDLPIPETMTRCPAVTPARISTARANAGPSVSASRCTAAASSASTRLPRSTSCLPSAADLGSCGRFTGLGTHGLPHALPDFDGESHDRGQLVERYHVGPIGRGVRGIRMRLEEEAVGPGGCRGIEQRRYERAIAAARSVAPLPRLLHRVRRLEDHGCVARGAPPRERPHVHDKITVAEERP